MCSQVDTSTTFIIYAYNLSVYSDLSRINPGVFEYRGDKTKMHFSSPKKKKKKKECDFHIVPKVKITEVSGKSLLAIDIVRSSGQT